MSQETNAKRILLTFEQKLHLVTVFDEQIKLGALNGMRQTEASKYLTKKCGFPVSVAVLRTVVRVTGKNWVRPTTKAATFHAVVTENVRTLWDILGQDDSLPVEALAALENLAEECGLAVEAE